MKRINIYIVLFCGLLLAGCKKDNPVTKLPGVSSLTVINARSDVSAALLNFSGGNISYATDQAAAYYQSFYEYATPPGNLSVRAVSGDDTTQTVLQSSFAVKSRGIYSLYLFGDTQNPQSLFMEDNIPAHKDSAAGVRFVNLSADSSPVNIVLEGSGHTELSGLAFKQVSAFKAYPATTAVANSGGYVFDVTDGSGNVLTSVYWNYAIFRNMTLVISGLQSDGSLGVFAVNNY